MGEYMSITSRCELVHLYLQVAVELLDSSDACLVVLPVVGLWGAEGGEGSSRPRNVIQQIVRERVTVRIWRDWMEVEEDG